MTSQVNRRVRDFAITAMLGLGVLLFGLALVYLMFLFLIWLMAVPPLIVIALLAVISIIAAVALM